MTLKAFQRLGTILVVAVLVPACDPFSGYFDPFPPTVAVADLRGSQVVPANASVSTGTASLSIAGLGDKIDFTVAYAGAGTVTSVKIHVGAAGANGSAIFTLATAPLTGTLKAADFTPAAAEGVPTFFDAVDRMKNGLTYIVVTETGPAGEIRGQIGAAPLASVALSAAQEVGPPVVSTKSGSASLLLNAAQTQIAVTLNVSDVTGVTAAHLHLGATGVGGGPILFNLSLVPFTNPLTVTLTAADFIMAGGLTSFADAVNALLSGLLYVNVHTGANPGGEIRGQVGPARLTCSLSAANVVPANSSTATGTASISLNGTQTAIHVTLTHSVGAPISVLIHADDPGFNGPQIFDVDAIAGTAASPVNASLNAPHLIPQPSKGVATFPQAVNALLTSKTYIDVGSTGFPFGEIRGQIVP